MRTASDVPTDPRFGNGARSVIDGRGTDRDRWVSPAISGAPPGRAASTGGGPPDCGVIGSIVIGDGTDESRWAVAVTSIGCGALAWTTEATTPFFWWSRP